MTYVIVTKQRDDGSYDLVGMANRRPMALKTERGILARCLRTGFCNGDDKIRMEWFYTAKHKKPYSTTYHQFDWQEEQAVGDATSVHKGTYTKPIERLVGYNRQMVQKRVGSSHVDRSLLHVARAARPKQFRQYPKELRRGWVLCVIQVWKRNRKEYYDVMTGNLGSGM